MGLMQVLGLGSAVRQTAEVFVENRTARAAQEHAEHVASLAQFGSEFAAPEAGFFNRFVDGLNRLPRPAMALGTIGLFCFAMTDPLAFGVRMQGLALVPEPMWWLLGAVVSFYFGARELHHFRGRLVAPSAEHVAAVTDNIKTLRALDPVEPAAPRAEPVLTAPPAPTADSGPVPEPVPTPKREPLRLHDLPPTQNAAVLEWRAQM